MLSPWTLDFLLTARQLHAAGEDGRFQRLEIPIVEPAPDVAREPIERPPVHPLDEPTPARNHHRRR